MISPTLEPMTPALASTGIEGLDVLLRGGLPRDDMHLLQGTAGTGKTTIALEFLLAGAAEGEATLYITLAQSKAGLLRIARSHGWSLDAITIHELSPADLMGRAQQSVLHTADVELGELTDELRRVVDGAGPRRVVFDSMGVIGLLAGSATRYHHEMVALREYLTERGCTSLFIGDSPADRWSEGGPSSEFHALVGSVIHVEQTAPDYGEARRRVRVIKMRGVPFLSGYHDFRILTGGARVFPRLGPTKNDRRPSDRLMASGIAMLDAMLGGGLEQGTSCVLLGSPGCGKSTLASAYARTAANGGDPAAIFLFDERAETWEARARGVGIDLSAHIASGRIVIHQPNAAEITAGEFAQSVRTAVERDRAKVVIIDSLTGYFNGMAEAKMLPVQMHELLNFLANNNVLTLLLIAKAGFMDIGAAPSADISYLSDSIVVLTMFEADGSVRRCLTAVKKRQGEHETSIRELVIRAGEVTVGKEPLRDYRGLMTGHPLPLKHRAVADDGDA